MREGEWEEEAGVSKADVIYGHSSGGWSGATMIKIENMSAERARVTEKQ